MRNVDRNQNTGDDEARAWANIHLANPEGGELAIFEGGLASTARANMQKDIFTGLV